MASIIILSMLFSWGYSNGNEAKSTHHFNRLLLCDHNDTSTLPAKRTGKLSAG